MDLEVAGHFRLYSAKRKNVTFRKICPAMKSQKAPPPRRGRMPPPLNPLPPGEGEKDFLQGRHS